MKLLPILLLALLPLTAQALQVGDRLTPWTLLDQYDQPYTLNSQTQTLLVARSMDAAKLVNVALKDKPKGFLESRQTVFVADIQKMPSVIASLFAIPKMRDYSYRVILDRDARIVPQYAGDEDKVLWLQLRDGQLVSQQQFSSAEQLLAALERQGQ
ncbi:hypothetical protein [Pseudomonas cichorii]|uniref:FAD/FMN-containing dehydrogenase n=1 Tax=Pseudomonas cichorii TaxID=36746 RepID=A0A3M4VZC0_PSECI|nr:hypothetical protein [Pseudomonas cichorii]AHF69489.1 hypothetical protein PCH70_43360 [Pseudomonas cichorii JBC1]QVE16427.1 hypothetical protein KGD89_21530 [Pseudomonas cichorii]RMR57095.1 hypothetical protein ALP84_02078 [Pseudomonas cichorii]SDN73093.1 hypothetical protein SAMN05216599_103141 [Pseudomonas cichorii]GFM67664.1 hypothetical protein PSCICJ_37820 [Pseudomonas cichorii]